MTQVIPAVCILIFLLRGFIKKKGNGLQSLFLLFCWNIYITAFTTMPSGPEAYFDALWCLFFILLLIYMYFDMSKKVNLLLARAATQDVNKSLEQTPPLKEEGGA